MKNTIEKTYHNEKIVNQDWLFYHKKQLNKENIQKAIIK
jgi:hypothetical protein